MDRWDDDDMAEGIGAMELDIPQFDGLTVDRTAIPQQSLDIDSKHRSNLFPWNGQFSPQLVDTLLNAFGPKDGFVLDPFAGSGTVLHEAGRRRLPVIGSEINPAAFRMANVYCLMRLSEAKRKSLLAEVEAVLLDFLPCDVRNLFSSVRNAPDANIKDSLILANGSLTNDDARSLMESLIVLLDFSKEFSSETVFRTWSILKAKFLGLPFTTSSVELLNNDARCLPLENDAIRFVLTSPPYINVFNYHQQYRKSVEALGWNPLAVARAEIGSNRKHRQNRFLTVIQYCLDMTDVLRELQRVCQTGSRAIMILGRESNVRKTRFFNGEIIMSLAMRCLGLEAMMRQERRFQNRFGELICEDILHFDVRKETNSQYDTPRTIAEEALTSARQRCPSESISDLEEAISAVHEVQPSQMFDLVSASNLPIEPPRSVVAS